MSPDGDVGRQRESRGAADRFRQCLLQLDAGAFVFELHDVPHIALGWTGSGRMPFF